MCGERGVKEILKENGFKILNNNAYTRDVKPHCHVIFDSEKNVIEKAFFTFNPEQKYTNFKLFDNDRIYDTSKKVRKLPKDFEALSQIEAF